MRFYGNLVSLEIITLTVLLTVCDRWPKLNRNHNEINFTADLNCSKSHDYSKYNRNLLVKVIINTHGK